MTLIKTDRLAPTFPSDDKTPRAYAMKNSENIDGSPFGYLNISPVPQFDEQALFIMDTGQE